MTKTFKLLPDLTCPELAGYKLPPYSRCQEDGVDLRQLSLDMGKEFYVGGNYDFENGVRKGYHKAREKSEFSESDLRRALSMAFIAVQDGGNITSDEIIQSIRTPRTPIAIEVEIIRVTLDGTVFPATHPDGTVKGRWVYE